MLTLLAALLLPSLTAAISPSSLVSTNTSLSPNLFPSFSRQHALAPPPPSHPPNDCFNCLLPAFTCQQFGDCSKYNGVCLCPPGFGGQDCSQPLCGSLADGDQRYPRKGDKCECTDGWEGINCNVCNDDRQCDAIVPPDDASSFPSYRGGDDDQKRSAGVCYKGGLPVNKMHSMCDVTNRKILDMLPDRPPQVTFACDTSASTCGFQFWIGQKESFYCGLEDCTAKLTSTYDSNQTSVRCEKVECACIPGRMLCGEEGSVNIDDFLAEEIKGPGTFDCTQTEAGGQSHCKFQEPAMNQLINDVFADEYITLKCDSGECVHYSQVPGYVRPPKPDNTKVLAASIVAAGLVVIAASLLFWYLGRAQFEDWKAGGVKLPTDVSEAGKLMSDHVPASLQFSDIAYSVRTPSTDAPLHVLSSITGSVQPGQTLAIMGASGAGKTTFLDILARRAKRGTVEGSVWVNGREFDDGKFRRVVGFVDQEDTLMGTLTVYETVLYSAKLRLPRDMSLEAKKLRVYQTMEELGIWGIRDSRIGESGRRSISGGEKRRVSIACELVTSPSILFLDEPTSGLDSYNAYNVIESLVNLARNYNRTVIFTIHQPRSNIVALFDRLVLLAKGRLVYSGPLGDCQGYFEGIGRPCPQGFNIADYLIDLTAQSDDLPDLSDRTGTGSESETNTAAPTVASSETSTDIPLTKPSSISKIPQGRLGPRLTELVSSFHSSDVARAMQDEIDVARSGGSNATPLGANGNRSGAVDEERQLAKLTGFKRASWFTQFRILSGRAFKNLYRNPMLMLTHYAISILVALICSFLFRNVTDDIPGFQNRMGLFFFILALFGFSCLTSLGVFANERILFMRERANGYYSPTTYFTAKVLFDVLPLRVVPPFILGAIIYGPVGLVPTVAEFWKCIFVLVLFNLAASSVVFFLSILISDTGVANLVGSLVMLFNLLFAGLLINRDNVPRGIGWLQKISFFHAAYEGLLVNEVRYLSLKDHRYGVDIEVPAAAILAIFGFDVRAFWWPDVAVLAIYTGAFLALSFVALVVLVKERR